MSLASSYELYQVLMKIVNLGIWLVTYVGVYLGWGCITDVATIGKDSGVGGANDRVNITNGCFTGILRSA